ncbi:MAG: hypothetical protein GY798_08100 [Hyphomicrobiales bacterium]|nr:hypothetical protein [Hyphomicrobiales bacterium]
MGDILDPIFGENSMVVLIGLVVAVLFIGGAYWFIRRSPRDVAGSVRGRPPRLAVVESIAVDGKRQLILVRRDGVEHLLLVGGLTDLVVEPTILRNRQRPARPAAASSPAANAPQPAPPPPPAERPGERAVARLRAIRAKKTALSESRSTDRTAAKKSETRQEPEPQRQPPPSRPPPTAERGPAPPAAPATPEPVPAETPAQPDTLQAALAAAEAHEPETDPRVTVVEAASPEERYRESPPSPFAPGAQNQPAAQSPFAPNREPQVLPTPTPATEEPVRPAPGAASPGQGETGAQAKILEKDMARLLGQISEDRRSENS